MKAFKISVCIWSHLFLNKIGKLLLKEVCEYTSILLCIIITSVSIRFESKPLIDKPFLKFEKLKFNIFLLDILIIWILFPFISKERDTIFLYIQFDVKTPGLFVIRNY